MPRTDWIPSREASFAAFAAAFSALVNTNYAAYGLSSGDNTTLAGLNTAYQAAYTLAVDPATRTKPNVAAKDVARASLTSEIRTLAMRIQANPSVTSSQLTELGITVPQVNPTPIAPPATKPVVSASPGSSLQIAIRIADESTPAKRAKPFGVKGAEVYYKTGSVAPASVADCVYAGLATRNGFTLHLPSGTGGLNVFVLARWISTRAQPGPTSGLVSATCPA